MLARGLDATGLGNRTGLRDERHRWCAGPVSDHVDEVVDQRRRHERDGYVVLDGLLDEVLGAFRDAVDRPRVVGCTSGVAIGVGQNRPSGSVLTGCATLSLNRLGSQCGLHYITKYKKVNILTIRPILT